MQACENGQNAFDRTKAYFMYNCEGENMSVGAANPLSGKRVHSVHRFTADVYHRIGPRTNVACILTSRRLLILLLLLFRCSTARFSANFAPLVWRLFVLHSTRKRSGTFTYEWQSTVTYTCTHAYLCTHAHVCTYVCVN